MAIVRQSNFRHVFGDPHKEVFNDIRLSTKASEGTGIKGNSKWIAVPWGSGGGEWLYRFVNFIYYSFTCATVGTLSHFNNHFFCFSTQIQFLFQAVPSPSWTIRSRDECPRVFR